MSFKRGIASPFDNEEELGPWLIRLRNCSSKYVIRTQGKAV